MTQKTQTVPEMLQEQADLYKSRNPTYGDSYRHFGPVFASLFPKGLRIEGPEDGNRIGVLIMMISKLTRYTANFERGGHADSLADLSVYSTMLRELDEGTKAPEDLPAPYPGEEADAPDVTAEQIGDWMAGQSGERF